MPTRKNANPAHRTAPEGPEPMTDLVYEAKMLVDLLPNLEDSFDKEGLPVEFILKRGRDRADAKARKEEARDQQTREQEANAPAHPTSDPV